MPFIAQRQRKFLEAARRDGDEDLFYDDLREGIHSGSWTANDFSLRDIFENFVDDGREIATSFGPRGNRQANGCLGVQLVESGINTGAFANIVGQMAYTAILGLHDDPSLIAPKLATHVQTQFDGEKIPGIGGLGDQAETVTPGDEYPMAFVGEHWINTPSTDKRGFIVPVLKEDIFFDRTGVLLERAKKVVWSLAINKEKRVIDAVTGQTNQYMRNGAAAIATYGDDSGSHDWDNLAASNALVDYSDVENALLLFDGLTDPETGEPILVNPNQLLIPSALRLTARRILHATEFQYVATHTTISGNPLAGTPPLDIVTNQYVKARTSSASTWFIGDFKAAFKYMENWGIESTEAPPNSEMEFTRDIAARFKVSERGVISTWEPRAVVKCTA